MMSLSTLKDRILSTLADVAKASAPTNALETAETTAPKTDEGSAEAGVASALSILSQKAQDSVDLAFLMQQNTDNQIRLEAARAENNASITAAQTEQDKAQAENRIKIIKALYPVACLGCGTACIVAVVTVWLVHMRHVNIRFSDLHSWYAIVLMGMGAISGVYGIAKGMFAFKRKRMRATSELGKTPPAKTAPSE